MSFWSKILDYLSLTNTDNEMSTEAIVPFVKPVKKPVIDNVGAGHPVIISTNAPVETSPVSNTVISNISDVSNVSNTISVPTRVMTSGPTIAIINLSTTLTDEQVQSGISAAQIQIDRDFSPIWGLPANLIFVSKNDFIPPTAWVLQVLDTSDQSGALGYHTLTNTEMPMGKIFAADDAKYGLSWTVTLTHELLEMLGDPYIDVCVFNQNSNTTGNLVAMENCDPVEDDSMGYLINGILVTDFVLPAFFENNRAPGSTKFDFCGHLTAPFSIGKGGYMSVFPVNPATKGWNQITGAEGIGTRLAAKIKREDSRTLKRAKKFKE